MSSDIINANLARGWDNWSPERRSHNVWATRYQLDGRCEVRKSKGNRSKRSLSPQSAGRETLATVTCAEPPSWVKPTERGKLEIARERMLGYATAVVVSSLNLNSYGVSYGK